MKKRMGRRGQVNPVEGAQPVEQNVQEAETGLDRKKLIIYIGIGVGVFLVLGIILAFVFLGDDENVIPPSTNEDNIPSGGDASQQDYSAGDFNSGMNFDTDNLSSNLSSGVSECVTMQDCETLYGADYVCIVGKCSFGGALPQISIVYPTNATYTSDITIINYTTNSNAKNCWYSKNNGITNSTPVVAGINFTGLTASSGGNKWIVYCNNSNNVLESDDVSFAFSTSAGFFDNFQPAS